MNNDPPVFLYISTLYLQRQSSNTELCEPPLCRHEHRPRGHRGPPRWHALLCPVADQQQVGHGLRQPGESQPRGGPGDGQAEGQASGEAGVVHGGSAGAQQQLLLIQSQ